MNYPRGTEWANRIRKLSPRFANFPGALSSAVRLVVQRETKYLVNTEGTRIQFGRISAQIMISAQGKASDGMDLGVHDSFEAEDPSQLPKDEVVVAAVDNAGTELAALLHAPVVDPYVGPAILSGRAAGVFFHEIFGHRVEGHRQKDEAEGQTFRKASGAGAARVPVCGFRPDPEDPPTGPPERIVRVRR